MLKVRIADTPSALEQGLMYVSHLPDDEGMLFVFRRPQPLHFWGKNTFIPLDIAFVDRDNRISKIGNIKPHSLRHTSSDSDCVMAIEANVGYFDRLGIGIGDEVVIDTDDWRKAATISFRKGKNVENQNIKESQSAIPPVGNQPPPTPPPAETVPPEEEQDESQLPVLDLGDLHQILEDSQDDEELPQEVQPEPEPTEEHKPDEAYPVFGNVFDALAWAEKNHEVVRIAYTTKRGRSISRDIEPHGSFHANSTAHQIVVTYDETVGDIRAFIMTNINAWSFAKRKFQKKFVVRA